MPQELYGYSQNRNFDIFIGKGWLKAKKIENLLFIYINERSNIFEGHSTVRIYHQRSTTAPRHHHRRNLQCHTGVGVVRKKTQPTMALQNGMVETCF